jgi:hypothetical protein
VKPLLVVLVDVAEKGSAHKVQLERLQNVLKERVACQTEQSLGIRIGNTWRALSRFERISSNPYCWTYFLQPSRPDIVAEIEVKLHPTFTPSEIPFKDPREIELIELTRYWSGTFTVQATIRLKDGFLVVLSHATKVQQKKTRHGSWYATFPGLLKPA